MHKFKGKYAEYDAMGEHQARFHLNLPQFRSVAVDLGIACLHSNLFWLVSCATSKTKAHTEISAWTIKSRL